MSDSWGDNFGTQHGTESKYTRVGCRCADCKAAHTAYRRKTAENKWDITLVHGSAGTYKNYGCRCPECKAAHSAYRREQRAENRRVYLETVQRMAEKNGEAS